MATVDHTTLACRAAQELSNRLTNVSGNRLFVASRRLDQAITRYITEPAPATLVILIRELERVCLLVERVPYTPTIPDDVRQSARHLLVHIRNSQQEMTRLATQLMVAKPTPTTLPVVQSLEDP